MERLTARAEPQITVEPRSYRVSIDTSQKRYDQFLRRFRVDFPTARDPEANISSNYGTFQIPETYLIDSTGKVREKIISNQNWVDPQFLDRVKTMLR